MFLLLLSGLCLVFGVKAQEECATALFQDQAFMDCYQGYTTLAGSAAQDPAIMCSEEGKNAVTCLKTFLDQCPSAMEGVSVDEMTKMCDMANEVSGPCAQPMTCLQSFSENATSPLPSPNFDPNNADVPFVTMQYFIGVTCGPMKEAYMCIEGFEGQCEMLTVMVTNITDMASKSAQKHGAKFPDSKTIKSFIKTHCPSIPDGFGGDSCVSTQLEAQEYLDCAKTASANVTDAKYSCEEYSGLTKCVETALKSKCGQEKYDVMINYSRYFVNVEAPTDCETSTASVVGTSVLSLVIATALFFLL